MEVRSGTGKGGGEQVGWGGGGPRGWQGGCSIQQLRISVQSSTPATFFPGSGLACTLPFVLHPLHMVPLVVDA